MPERGWPSEKARNRRDELERDPHGAGFLDVRALLELWNVNESLRGDDLMGYEALFHPDAPSIIFYYPLRVELAPATVQGICRQLRHLERRLTE